MSRIQKRNLVYTRLRGYHIPRSLAYRLTVWAVR